MAINYGQVGPGATYSDGTDAPARMTKDGSQAVVESHARYQEAVARGNVFFGSAQAAVALTTLGTTSQTGLILVNPPNSGKNCVLLQVELAISAQASGPSVVAVAVQTYSSAATLPTSISKCALVGQNSPTSVGLLTTSTGLQSNVVAAKVLYSQITTATNPAIPAYYDIGGAIMLAPGTAACISGVVLTGATSACASMTWEEIPV